MSIVATLTRLFSVYTLTLTALHAAEWRLTVDAGDYERRDCLVTFAAPSAVRGNYLLRDTAGHTLPLQVAADGRAMFTEPSLGKGERKTYVLAPPEGVTDVLTVAREGAVLKLTAGAGKTPLFQYQTEPAPAPPGVPEGFRHGAFLHPVFSPAGKVVTANHPPDHLHQRGIFFAWTKTEFEGRHPDFWNMGKDQSGQLTGEVRFAALDRTWNGPVQAGFTSRHRFIDHTGGSEKDVLAETWEVAATHLPGANVIDFISTQTTAGDAVLKLPKYHYGGLGIRGAAPWDPEDKVTMLTSNGDDRKTGDNSKAKWVQLGGLIDGQPAGIALLIHPGNFRFPQPLRLNPKNPQICVAPSQDGDWEITPGKPYVSRYRIVITDSAADRVEIERQWNDYATPPKVSLQER